MRGVVCTQNVGGLSYVEEALRQELEKSEMRVRLMKKRLKIKDKEKEEAEDAEDGAEGGGSAEQPLVVGEVAAAETAEDAAAAIARLHVT